MADRHPEAFTAAEYERAAEILDENHWRKGSYGHDGDAVVGVKGSYCAVGALRVARHGSLVDAQGVFWDNAAEIQAQVGIDMELSSNGFKAGASSPFAVVDFNDNVAKSKEEVQEKLLLAAKNLRNQGERLDEPKGESL